MCFQDNDGGFYNDAHPIQYEALCNPGQFDAIISSLAHETQEMQAELQEMASQNWEQHVSYVVP